MFARFGNLELVFEQADTTLTISKLAMFSLVLGLAGGAVTIVMKAPVAMAPLAAICGRIAADVLALDAAQAAVEYVQHAIARRPGNDGPRARAGQSLSFGFNAVASEMAAPIGKEFGRMFDEQNLGVAMDDSLRAMCERVPNLDLRFFVTAVILQRQTGGDLSEILDKIGTLIRNRFKILGQVKALTGEGRLSGIVLMALPLVLFVIVYNLNPGYVSQLFTDRAGREMLAIADSHASPRRDCDQEDRGD